MKTVILAGGLGTRLSEETVIKPKPMVEIGGYPILWHIMKIYSSYGFNDFVVCLGYKGHMIKEWFANYYLYNSDIRIDIKSNKIEVLNSKTEDWKITLVDTGQDTQVGGRIKRVGKYLDGTFMLTYGDGLSNLNINSLTKFHKEHGKLATVTAVRPPGRFGALDVEGDRVKQFLEKPPGDGNWINGGFFVLEPGVLDFIDGDTSVWEKEPLENIAKKNQLMAYKHEGFWKPMDKLKDKMDLDALWEGGKAPWKVWK